MASKRVCERQTCGVVLADAFAEDPVFLWFGPKKAYDVSLRKLMGIFLWALGESYDLCDVARNEDNGGIVSVALWEPATPHFAAVLRSIVLVVSFFWVCGLWKGLEAARFFLTLEHERARLAGPRHFHLQLIGTDPREQRKGYGTQAIAHGLARADELGVPTYLESTNPDNERFYLRQGFKVLKEVRARNGGPVVVLMLREPRAAKPSRRWTTRT